MSLNFPASPSNGDQYTSAGIIYTWDGQKWVTGGFSPTYVKTSGDTMTGNLNVISGGKVTSASTVASDSGTTLVTKDYLSSLRQKVANLRDEKPTDVDGGTNIVGWQTRTLNTEEDPDNIVTLSSNEFTLSAGEYQIEWSAPVYRADRNQSKMTNVTNGTTQVMGSSEKCGDTGNISNRSFGSTRVKITSDTTYKIEHYCERVRSTNGLGASSGSGEPEVYTQVTITDLVMS